jgi:hypothetical protein
MLRATHDPVAAAKFVGDRVETVTRQCVQILDEEQIKENARIPGLAFEAIEPTSAEVRSLSPR